MTSLLPLRFDSPARVPSRLHGYLSVNSKGGKSVLDAATLPSKTDAFHGSKQDTSQAIKAAESSGLEVIAQSRLGLAVVGPASAYEELTGGKVLTQELLVYAEAGTRRYVTHVDITGKNQPTELGYGLPKTKNSGIEAVILERPRAPQASLLCLPQLYLEHHKAAEYGRALFRQTFQGSTCEFRRMLPSAWDRRRPKNKGSEVRV